MSDLFDFGPKKRLFVVMGNPINHSKSPYIHGLFGLQTDIKMDYTTMHVDRGGFESAVRNFYANGGTGLNVTVPFKLEACELADHVHLFAQKAGAANTLWFDDKGDIHADNTDGRGLRYDIETNLNVSLKGQRILILGAGGAVRGVLQPFLEAGPASITIANRTVDKAVGLSRDFTGDIEVHGSSYRDLKGKQFDVVVNGTSASLEGCLLPVPEESVKNAILVYDMMYADQPTIFMQWAADLGVKNIHDGIGMLVEQAAEAFAIWNDVRPDTVSVLESLMSKRVAANAQ